MIINLLRDNSSKFYLRILFFLIIFPCLIQAQDPVKFDLKIVHPVDTAVKIMYGDTLILPSNKDFDLNVKMRPACEIAAISIGIYFPPEYLEITDVLLKDTDHGYTWNVTGNRMLLAWSSINPIIVSENDDILVLKMKTLDISGLQGTIKLGLVETTEFADPTANVIEDIELEVPEIQYLKPDTIDTLTGYYARIYPNPFRDFSTLYFGLKEESKIRISIVNTDGILIIDKGEKTYTEGEHQLRIDGLDLAKGSYFLKFEMTNSAGREEEMFRIVSVR